MSQDRLCEAAEVATGEPLISVRFLEPCPPYLQGQAYQLRAGGALKLLAAGVVEHEGITEDSDVG